MVLRWQMFHGGPFQLIGIITRLMATIGVIGLSGMKFGTNDEWRIYCRGKRMASPLHRVTGAPNWKGWRLGEKSQTVSRLSLKKATDPWGPFICAIHVWSWSVFFLSWLFAWYNLPSIAVYFSCHDVYFFSVCRWWPSSDDCSMRLIVIFCKYIIC